MALLEPTLEEQRRIRAAITLLARAAPAHHQHLESTGLEILRGPGECGPDAIACTGGQYGALIVLRESPVRQSIVELAVTISHEARHYCWTDAGWEMVTHSCVDCGRPLERSRDPIYIEDARLRRHLEKYKQVEQAAQRSQHTAPRVRFAAATACALLAVVAGGLALEAMR